MVTRTRQPTIPLTEIEHAAFCRPEDELPAKSLAEELAINVRWQKNTGEYLACSPAELDERIGVARRALGESVTVLGHHYQREEIIKYADFQGDSFLLSQEAASRPEADFIVFLRRTLHGGDSVHPGGKSPAGYSAQHHRRVFHGRHGPRSRTWRMAGTTCRTCWATTAASCQLRT